MPGTAALHERLSYIYFLGPALDINIGAAPTVSPALVTGARSVAIARGCDVYLRQGGAGLLATAADYRLPARLRCRPFNVDDTSNNRISAVTANGQAGTLRIMRIDALLGVLAGDPARQKAIARTEFLGATIKRTVTNSSQSVSSLVSGRYAFICYDDDILITQGAPGLVCSEANPTEKPHFYAAGDRITFNVDGGGNNSIAFRSATNSSGATLQVQRIDDV